jgi:ribosomal protein S18 acetylase RimI-like enzyme
MENVTPIQMAVRPYEDADMPRLLDTFASWIAEAGCCGYDHIGELVPRIYENLRGRCPVGELVHLWEADAQIAGLTICLRSGDTFDVFTAPSLRGTSAEVQMLKSAAGTTARYMAGAGAGPHVLTEVFSNDTERVRLLAELGFRKFRTWHHGRQREFAGPVGVPLLPRGFLVRGGRPDDADMLADARNHSFGDNWTGDQYRSQVMEKPGYDAAREIVAVSPDGRIAAFADYWTDALNKTGHFEPVGTHREFRRLGLARVVMLHAMKEMRALGMSTVTVNHDAENVAAGKLYEALGFEITGVTSGYRRLVVAGHLSASGRHPKPI